MLSKCMCRPVAVLAEGEATGARDAIASMSATVSRFGAADADIRLLRVAVVLNFWVVVRFF